MLTKFRQCLVGIFALYELIFSAIRMEFIDHMALARSAKLIFVVMILIIEFGIFYYASNAWNVYEAVSNFNDFDEIKKYRRNMILAILYSLFAIAVTFLDIMLVQSYFTGIMFNAIVISDLVCFVVYAKSVVNYGYNRSLA